MRLTGSIKWTFLDIGKGMRTSTRFSLTVTSQYTPGETHVRAALGGAFFPLFTGGVDDLDVERTLLFKCCIHRNTEL